MHIHYIDTHAYLHTQPPPCLPACMLACLPALCMHAYIPTYIGKSIHEGVHIHIHIHKLSLCLSLSRTCADTLPHTLGCGHKRTQQIQICTYVLTQVTVFCGRSHGRCGCCFRLRVAKMQHRRYSNHVTSENNDHSKPTLTPPEALNHLEHWAPPSKVQLQQSLGEILLQLHTEA